MGEPLEVQSAKGSLRITVSAAFVEAQRRGSPTIEAEDLMLAIAADRRTAAGALLIDQGLTHDAILAALAGEREHALRAVGVEPWTPERLAATRIKRPGWGQSARQALMRAHGMSARRRLHDDERAGRTGVGGRPSGRAGRGGHRPRMDDIDLLLGILSLDLGTVPRALELAGFDRDALRDTILDLAERRPG